MHADDKVLFYDDNDIKNALQLTANILSEFVSVLHKIFFEAQHKEN